MEYERVLDFGTRLGMELTAALGCIPTTMKPVLNHYLKLKREAMRQMLTGDVERYMNTLRQLSNLRLAQRGLA